MSIQAAEDLVRAYKSGSFGRSTFVIRAVQLVAENGVDPVLRSLPHNLRERVEKVLRDPEFGTQPIFTSAGTIECLKSGTMIAVYEWLGSEVKKQAMQTAAYTELPSSLGGNSPRFESDDLLEGPVRLRHLSEGRSASDHVRAR